MAAGIVLKTSKVPSRAMAKIRTGLSTSVNAARMTNVAVVMRFACKYLRLGRKSNGRDGVGIEGVARNVLKIGENFSALRTFFRRDQLKGSHLDCGGSLRRFYGGFTRCLLDRLTRLGFVDFGEEFVRGNVNVLALLAHVEGQHTLVQ